MALPRIGAGRELPFISFGDSDKMHVGDTVIGLFDTSVTTGIVSAVNRVIMESPFDDQTGAAINHGNSTSRVRFALLVVTFAPPVRHPPRRTRRQSRASHQA